MEPLNIRELVNNIIGKKFDEILKEYDWCDIMPVGIMGSTYVQIGDFEAYASIGFYSSTNNNIVTNCIISIGEPRDLEKYHKELTARKEIVSWLDKYYGMPIPVPDQKNIFIAWDIDEEKILLYCVSEGGAVSLQLYSKSDRKAQPLLDVINVKSKRIKDPNIEIIDKLDAILLKLFTVLLNIYIDKFPSDARVNNQHRAGIVLNELVLEKLRGEQVIAFKEGNTDFINKEKIRLMEIEEIRNGVLSFLIAKGAMMKIWDKTESNIWIDKAQELEPSITVPAKLGEILKIIEAYLADK